MNWREKKEAFEREHKEHDNSILTFTGVEGYDVYNTSIPFYRQGKQYLFGRVERRKEWARSWVRLFENTGADRWSLVAESPWYQLEDPYISILDGTLIMGGTHVRYNKSEIETYYGYFYKGTDIRDLYYYTTGPDYMKDIRLVKLADGKIGVFSRPRNEEIREKYNCDSLIGFSRIDSIQELSREVIEKAPYITGMFGEGEWGGCNQCYLLESGRIGVIGHRCYKDGEDGRSVYFNTAFVFDPETRQVSEEQVIGTRSSYPMGPAKKANLVDCAFSSGIVMREDGKADLYSGIGDCAEGRCVIEYPFSAHGRMISELSL